MDDAAAAWCAWDLAGRPGEPYFVCDTCGDRMPLKFQPTHARICGAVAQLYGTADEVDHVAARWAEDARRSG